MLQRRKAGQSHAHDGGLHPRFAQEIEGDQNTVIESRVSLAERTGPQPCSLSPAHDLIPQRNIVLHLDAYLRRAEGRHIAYRSAAGGNMKIVPVHNRVGRGHDEHIGIPPGHLLRCGTHGTVGGMNLLFPPPAHLRQQHRRMWGQNCTKHRHMGTLLSPVWLRNHTLSQLIVPHPLCPYKRRLFGSPITQPTDGSRPSSHAAAPPSLPLDLMGVLRAKSPVFFSKAIVKKAGPPINLRAPVRWPDRSSRFDESQPSLPYASSDTASSHSLEQFSPGTSRARWENQLSQAAPCQCFTSGGMLTTSPGCSSRASWPHS